ncbi:helix-turn-helix domain-containing protein [Tistlia consotensis]|uniref:helix-turn-helix domain-containing protein n=1 Tax=Tistlia consotensis TaxID=1321365 RepID=UPI00190EADA8|nr:XRE family transcriptional regulator [Tistlia consotensis]
MLNKKGFAELAGVAQHTVVRCEKGLTEPTAENVDAFSRALAFPTSFFFGPDLDEPESASFRSQTSMSAAIRDASLAAGAIGFMLSDWVEDRFNLPEIQVPDLHLYDPERAARVLREEWRLGEKPISNMIHLLESKGVRVFSLAENTVKVNAYSLWRRDKPYMFLNTYKSAESSRFDAAHELGHLVLHQDGGCVGRKAESEANQFASAFLMPSADVMAVLPRAQYLPQILRAKLRWRVSLAALNFRLHKLGITSDWKYRDFCIEIATKGYNKSEPHPIERESSVVWQKVLQNLWAHKMTPGHVARELAVPESEISGLIFGVIASQAVPVERTRPVAVVNNER